jgi:hypothetical protein
VIGRFSPFALWDPAFIYVKPGVYIWLRPDGGLSLCFVELVARVPPIGRMVGEIFGGLKPLA